MKKVHLGCGLTPFDGWDNLDILDLPGIIKHDLRQPLPYLENSIDYIFSEHFLEHLDEVDGYGLLSDCFAKLKNDGILRISLPCLDEILYVYGNYDLEYSSFHPYIRKFSSKEQFINWAFFGESSTLQKNKFLNGLVSTNDGHKYLYSKKEIENKLKNIGFKQINFYNKKESQTEQLRNLESRQQICDMTLEAIK
jgi:predicted SAM-dependent methyltransferase